MPKTIESRIEEAYNNLEKWLKLINNSEALNNLNKTREEAIALANYYEGLYDGLTMFRGDNQ